MVNERALIEAFKNIKKEMDDLRNEIRKISESLNLKSNGNSEEIITKMQEKINNLNYAEEDIVNEIKVTKIKKQEIKEIKEVEELDDNIDLADSYY